MRFSNVTLPFFVCASVLKNLVNPQSKIIKIAMFYFKFYLIQKVKVLWTYLTPLSQDDVSGEQTFFVIKIVSFYYKRHWLTEWWLLKTSMAILCKFTSLKMATPQTGKNILQNDVIGRKRVLICQLSKKLVS